MSDKAYTVIGTNVVIDCGTVEEAIAYERELWANQPYAPATPAPLDVDAPDNANAATTSANATPAPLDVHTDLLLLIAECLVPLAFAASPDGGRRQSRLAAIAAAYAEETE